MSSSTYPDLVEHYPPAQRRGFSKVGTKSPLSQAASQAILHAKTTPKTPEVPVYSTMGRTDWMVWAPKWSSMNNGRREPAGHGAMGRSASMPGLSRHRSSGRR
mmetsp:Transcript_1211/g.2867  ORF Transcript_1211/g.2867 Transcript_1211/m.2867 type:complete len:103 (-) Transcript_1211:12-320(-)